jgi:hypothetical protein
METVTQFKDLNDAFPKGPLEVWYLRPEAFRDFGSFGNDPNPQDLDKTHILLGSIAEADMDTMWIELQGERWSRQGEANHLIRSKGLQHTSMSVGDCFRLNGVVSRVEGDGFKKL